MASLPRNDFSPQRAAPAASIRIGAGGRGIPQDVNWRRRSHLTFWKIAFLAAANAAVVLFLVRNFSTPADIHTASWDSIVGLPNAQGDCLAGVQYADLTGDGKDDVLVQARPGCGDAGLSLWVYGMGDGQPRALWGRQGEPAMTVPAGDVTVTQ